VDGAEAGSMGNSARNGWPPPPSANRPWRRDLRIDDGGRAFRIAIHSQGLEIGDELRDLVEARLRKNLGPYAAQIVVAHVRLWTPMEGDEPGVCQVRVELRPSGGLALGETGCNLATAVERAADRMKGALAASFARKEAMASQAWLR
jgi:ribosome-associated translation inhibitor RaiA